MQSMPRRNCAQASDHAFDYLCTSYSIESFGLAYVLQNPIAEMQQMGIFDKKL